MIDLIVLSLAQGFVKWKIRVEAKMLESRITKLNNLQAEEGELDPNQ